MEVIEQLQQLGFSQYEAKAYVALLRESPLNGYELAKASGIPRANIYAVLRKLEESGAVMCAALANRKRYVPVPAAELLAKLKQRYQHTLDEASEGLEQITAPPHLEQVLNVRGYAELLDQARALLERTQRRLLVSAWPEEAQALAGPIRQAQERGACVTTLCLRGCPQPCPACSGTVFRYALAPVQDTRWLVLVSDQDELLAGEIPEGSRPAAAVRTRQQMLVNLTGSYIQNSIALAAILTGLGKQLYSTLDPQTTAALNQLRPLQTGEAWLDVMRQTLRLEGEIEHKNNKGATNGDHPPTER